jgi:diguanylate cyclase (GGDEF)-like protein
MEIAMLNTVNSCDITSSLIELYNGIIFKCDEYGNSVEILNYDESKIFIAEDISKFVSITQKVLELISSATNSNYKEKDYTNISLKNGKSFFVEIEVFYISSVLNKCILVAIKNISTSKTSKNILIRDELTGLFNKNNFSNKLKSSISRAARQQTLSAVMLIHIREHKDVLFNLGQKYADSLLIRVAEVLKNTLREYDTIARFDGSTFALISENLNQSEDAAIVVSKIKEGLKNDIVIEDYNLEVSFNTGIVIFPSETDNVNVMIDYANQALSHSINNNNIYEYHSEDLTKESFEFFDISNKLKKAIRKDEFFIEYQPQYCAIDNNVVGVEALIRWKNGDLGKVSPAKFIPIAESSGVMNELGDWILNSVFKQIKKWQKQGKKFIVAINLSRKQLQDKHMAKHIKEKIEFYDVNPKYIEFEITESSIMEDPDIATRTIEKIRALGCLVSIDDFGTGYSSLKSLRDFSLDKLKIDKSFIDDLSKTSSGDTIIKATISLAKSLGLKVIAEGVETNSQLRFLQRNNCDEIQGFLFSKPLSADKITTLTI